MTERQIPAADILTVGDGTYRLIKQPSYAEPALNQVCIETIYTNHEDDSSDTTQAYFEVEQRQADGSYRKLDAREFGYPMQRVLQPQLEAMGRSAEGPWYCNTSHKFVSVHIPINQPRYMAAEQKRAEANDSK